MNSSSSNKIIPPEILLNGYRQGIFPMSESREDRKVGWYSARQRGIIPMDRFKVSKNVERIIRQERYECRVNTCFRDVMEECADRNTTWISDLIINSFELLHLAGHAHSVEMFNKQGELAGGLYGVTLGAAFFGESMFKNSKEADKVALWHCHRILEKNGFELWDTQFYTDHLARFGCIEIPASEYDRRLERALKKECEFVD
ncbi:MAG: leucyl/phenylalanyl-tRNA--protein transferase [Balneolaceae bacterium]|nr:MAG: leucyl/phenylalanyl-tRNA--protein transferase [Balneolaceae bacterium]